jgi:acetoin utilization deacetylase AcuC-like enzyme
MGSLGFVENDYAWVTQQLVDVAKECGHRRIVSTLEGGYNLSSLARAAVAHVKALAES